VENDLRRWESSGVPPNHHYDDNMPPWKMTIAVEGPVVGPLTSATTTTCPCRKSPSPPRQPWVSTDAQLLPTTC